MALFPEVNREDKQDVTKERSSSESETQLQEASESAKTAPLIQKSSEDANNSNDPADLGERFWQWLKMGLADHSIVINDTKAPVHTVNGTYFLVSPGIFKRFCNSVLNDKNQWQAVQKRFQKLGVHVRTKGQNIHKVSVEGKNKTGNLMGYLIKDPVLVSQKIPPDNWVLTLVTTKGEKGVSDE
ncbi:hypothetical protein FZZ93_03065 [Halomonas eurihalina]|uniref:Putative conjugal transfer nickase/helicase TraI C-terminal domain-containing protein n=1 Tax=Halomonas eurihalina TaxID=42566 RepID=A0A5D9DB07_HALER|nr:DNA-binding domain-containing protein [Halomonas eurihalina]MDR5859279.1 DNA-binding domain-containing protein [Halomonas eurihalina]TZG40897.1 hypothetical protein FZZ93_03065 [Halomonas eurihalina]